MLTGWHYLPGGEDDPSGPLPASTFLDIAPGAGMRSPERLCRIFFKGRPDPTEVAHKVSLWHQRGARVQLANEPNLPQEQFGGGLPEYAWWFAAIKSKLPGARCYWAGMSPGVLGWADWYFGARQAGADGVATHAYGTLDQMRDAVLRVQEMTGGLPQWIAECNFGAGQEVARDRWADEHLRPFLDWCATVPQVEAVTYFAYKWPSPDMALPTPVDGAGTRIETVLRAWTPPPQEVPVAGLKGIDVSNNNGHVDLVKVKAAGYAFVAMKASGDEGTNDVFFDPTFAENWHLANAQAMVRIAYHYARPSVASPAQSVTILERAIQAVGGLKPGDLVALDLEDPAVPDGVSLHAWCAEWLALAESVFGVAPLKYSARYYTQPHDLEHADLERWPTWWASWQATVPAPVTGWGPILLWQNSASARVPGVRGDCDTDVFMGTVEQLRAMGLPASAGPSGPGSAGPDAVTTALDGVWALTERLAAIEHAPLAEEFQRKIADLKSAIGR